MDSDFWKKRVEKYGHTGWASNSIYEFDQPIRLQIVNSLVQSNLHEIGGRVLDFGCGSGEFAKLLCDRFDTIVLYDTCEEVIRLAIKDLPHAEAITSLDNLKNKKYSYKLVLSITVLQHILDDKELDEVISIMANRLADDGILIIMEQFHRRDSGYTRNWNVSDFISLMENSGLKLSDAYDFYEYGIMKDPVFNQYRFRPDVFVLSHIEAHIPRTRVIFHPVYEKICKKKQFAANVDRFLFPFTREDGDKFMVFNKIASTKRKTENICK